jgi:N-acetylmuramoyl-L-alanine amidase
MKNPSPLARLVLALFLGWVSGASFAAIEVENLRMWPAPDNTRLVFDISGPVRHQVFTMYNPDRVVIDLPHTRLRDSLKQPPVGNGVLSGIRYASRPNGDLRVVLDLRKRAIVRSSVLKPNQQYGHRLLIELADERPVVTVAARPASPPPVKLAPPIGKVIAQQGRTGRDVIVAIDAGHGGEDPGAMGKTGAREKDITLAIARLLMAAIDRTEGMRAVLIRDGDYFIPLRKRMELAREHRADLFVSIHADAYRDPRVNGSTVYVLSQRGASSEAARWLADQENASDLVGGVTLQDKDDLLKSVLLDLSQTASLEASVQVAGKVLARLDEVGNVHRRKVQHAGFMVLKSPDIPSILIETAFITNPAEEKKLRNPRHQRALATAIAQGIGRYFEDVPPPGTLMAERRGAKVAVNP